MGEFDSTCRHRTKQQASKTKRNKTRRSNTISVIKTGAMTMGMCLLLFSPGQAHALRDNRKLLFGPVGGAVTSIGASTLNGLGIDNDCDGNSGVDKRKLLFWLRWWCGDKPWCKHS